MMKKLRIFRGKVRKDLIRKLKEVYADKPKPINPIEVAKAISPAIPNNDGTFPHMNKYGSKSQIYGGRRYDSVKEADYAKQLDWQKRAGEIKEIIPQYRINIEINGHRICSYYIDFKIVFTSGKIEYHEVKGFETPEWKIKWKLAQALYPEYEFKLIK